MHTQHEYVDTNIVLLRIIASIRQYDVSNKHTNLLNRFGKVNGAESMMAVCVCNICDNCSM